MMKKQYWTPEEKKQHRNTEDQKKQAKGRVQARKMLVKLGFLMPVRYCTQKYVFLNLVWKQKKDPRQVHHLDRNPLNNSLSNLVALNKCAHKKIHGGECIKTQKTKEDERYFPSFYFDKNKKMKPWEAYLFISIFLFL